MPCIQTQYPDAASLSVASSTFFASRFEECILGAPYPTFVHPFADTAVRNQSFPGQAALEEYRRFAPPPPPNTTGQGFVYWNERAPRSPSPSRRGHDQHGQYRGDPAAAGVSRHPYHQPSSHDVVRPPWGRVDDADNGRGLTSVSGRDGYRSDSYDQQGSGSGQGHQAISNEDIIPAVRSPGDPLIEFDAGFKSRAARGDKFDADYVDGRVCCFEAFDSY